ncbi:putative Pol II transcription elongation factor [Naematelia encephala]|uniref:Putative Pol II transcription elongation factor n=1 Tax=Naematelia encephala TaxID=71784 RepID=A0A1Y2BB77_9TREE|nr:putative Pol II transcription elongation factor [Naematelia encephala]
MADQFSAGGRTVVIVGQGGVQTDIDLDTLGDEEIANVIPELLADYAAEVRDWTLLAGEHWRQGRMERVQDLLLRGIQFFGGGPGRQSDPTALVNLHSMLAHVHLALARTAPQVSLPHAKYDKIASTIRTKEWHYTEATVNLNGADAAFRASGAGPEEEPVALAMGKIILYLARGQPNVAHPLVDRLLLRQPNNIIALTAQARLQFARRAHEAAFATYQKLLSLNHEMSPDPRIGLGLCAWVLGDKEKARAAWERALQRDPQSWTSLLLLGLGSLNTAREPSVRQEERIRLEAEGVAYVQRAFKLNNKSAAAALALATVSGQGGQLPLASKLAERAIQYADNKRHSILANSERGRLGFVAGDIADAGPFIAAAKKEEAAGVNILAELTLGQIAIKNGNLREALNFIEQTAKRLNGKGPLEYTVLHACLLAYPHPGMKDDELAKNRLTARNMLTEVHNLVANASTEEDWARLRGVGQDADVFLDLAKLWQDESLDKAIGAYQTAVTCSSDDAEDGATVNTRSVRISSNLGALFQLQGNVETAERMYQEALQKLAQDTGNESEVLKTVLAYNLARAYEEEGDVVKATQWYRDVLRQHPEHMESKVRLAMLATSAGRNFDAHTLLKECLKSDESNVTLRSVYSNFLISIGSYKEALAFTTQTLKFDRNDPGTFCALGWLHFTLGREAKASAEVAERPKQYARSAEAYERALILDPTCATAAQGLAIALVEDTLSAGPHGALAPVDEAKHRIRLAGQALSVFSRISDSLSGGAVNVNMGHCYFARGEEEKAIQAYEAALDSFQGRNVSVLLYLARAWYAYANRESNFSAMSKALSYCQKAMHIQPSDRAILYNIAMIQQKAAEMLLALDPAKRTLEELNRALDQAQQAANTFRVLADDRSGALPYDVDLADQRARYGDGLLRKAPEQIARQEEYEGQAAARVEEARKLRAAELHATLSLRLKLLSLLRDVDKLQRRLRPSNSPTPNAELKKRPRGQLKVRSGGERRRKGTLKVMRKVKKEGRNLEGNEKLQVVGRRVGKYGVRVKCQVRRVRQRDLKWMMRRV